MTSSSSTKLPGEPRTLIAHCVDAGPEAAAKKIGVDSPTTTQYF